MMIWGAILLLLAGFIVAVGAGQRMRDAELALADEGEGSGWLIVGFALLLAAVFLAYRAGVVA